ncbi:hypothetical protein KTD15_06350 [Burkholderia multivorans]|uniref:hypothetical protein n=1 Tax=Burkholderia multivorans TaxID=87883 RepID=UPI001C23487F|nr:hypothetical protein [Burkholderia multivorans]MBU9118415.1 hypothetical protein [Burkholderia multivorans]
MSNDIKKQIADARYELENALGSIEFHTERIKAALKSLNEISEKSDNEAISSEEDYFIWSTEMIAKRYIRNTEEGKEDISVFYSLHDKHENYLAEKKESQRG